MKHLLLCVIACGVAAAFAACRAPEKEEPATTETAAGAGAENEGPPAEEVSFPTADGWEIHATYWEAGEGLPAVVLLHMLPADRTSYAAFGAQLAAAGFNVLALDSRGHGESLNHRGETRRYQDFSDDDHRSSVADVAAAKEFLASRGAEAAKLGLVGASIGANFALNYAAGDGDVRAVVLLSPGLDYHGVTTAEALMAYGERPVYLVASEADSYAAESVGKLHEMAGHADFQLFTNAGHGTQIFDAEPAFRDTLVAWLGDHVK
ncbi:MAG: alpha/beta fold hydrolase [Candidatus Coatesbacteria bacterium]|nr:MAG: alpha/beta fold hydrolase [Candidatus Coatesbacteria bacterium]